MEGGDPSSETHVMAQQLMAERQIFEQHLPAWRSQYLGKYVLIKGQEVVGFYDSLDSATKEGFKRFGLDDFFVTRIDPTEVVNVTFLGQRI